MPTTRSSDEAEAPAPAPGQQQATAQTAVPQVSTTAPFKPKKPKFGGLDPVDSN